jgi:hypothetical protein
MSALRPIRDVLVAMTQWADLEIAALKILDPVRMVKYDATEFWNYENTILDCTNGRCLPHGL